MKQTLFTAVGALVGGFGTMVFLVSIGNDHMPPYVFVIAAFGAILGAAVARSAVTPKTKL